MKRGLTAFAAAFGLALALATLASGCWLVDCDCGTYPDRPPAQPPIAGLQISPVSTGGRPADIAVKPERGTVEVTGNTVVFVYQQGGVEHRIVYEVTGRL